MSCIAADFIIEQIREKPASNLGLATGSTPLGLYERLVDLNRNGKVDFSKVSTINLDEYCGLAPEHKQSYGYYMDTNLFSKVNIKKKNTHLLNGLASDIDAECKRYDHLIDSLGGIDLQILGIGFNGHIGFNEPSDEFVRNTYCVKLARKTITANSRFFNSVSQVPRFALTMGIYTIMMSRKLILLADANKQDILTKALYGSITPKVPASICSLHQNLMVICCSGKQI